MFSIVCAIIASFAMMYLGWVSITSILRIDRLEKENKKLREENRRLKNFTGFREHKDPAEEIWDSL